MADAVYRLGPRAVALGAWGKGPGRWLAGRRLGVALADPLAGADIRLLWEANRWTHLPPDPEPFCHAWMAENPPFQGPNWLCGQEAALRALHLALALPSPAPGWAREVLAAHARRIAANPAYALAQDNNHPVSEAAGLLACRLLLGGDARAASRKLDAVVARLVAPDGGFAQPSPTYHRLMLDVLTAAETLRRRWNGPPAAPATLARAAAATRFLARVTCPRTGALPRIGHQDGSAFDGFPDDARGSLVRAKALFGAAGPAPEWSVAGYRGWSAGGARAVMRVGPPRFRPGHADLLHLDLWDGPLNLLRDGGTGAYNPAPRDGWWLDYFPSTAAHNTVEFDGRDQMPRVSRFLHARWVAAGDDWARDAAGCRHRRQVSVEGREWRVLDRLDGPFAQATLRWRLAPAEWRLTGDGAESPLARIGLRADAPLEIALEEGRESLAYGQVSRCPVLVARGRPGWIETLVRLPG
ncbi:heparinase II/III family protein [Rhodovarius lipocyclicus]|uniref:heparinase II/III family protein n=1 Tax=Rhodovarius lipocyclicus TaxID=268410 RepID=UPI001F3B6885|nr:heparinase II/III-family protein [Rhodovarius lipocyclicus]